MSLQILTSTYMLEMHN